MTNSIGIPADQLRSFIERIERLEEEKKGIQSDITCLKSEAKSMGFDIKTINQIIKDRKVTSDQLAEQEALLDIYRAALGMLHDTPLGEAARRQLSGKPAAIDPEDKTETKENIKAFGDKDITIEKAQEMGFEAATNGAKVIDNPFIAGDPRRAAWDQGWCKAAGHDGMEIPDTWRRPSHGSAKADNSKETKAEKKPDKSDAGKDIKTSDKKAAAKPKNKTAPKKGGKK